VDLLDNGGDIDLIATESGFSKETLERWRKKFGKKGPPPVAPSGLLAAAKKAAGMDGPLPAPTPAPKAETAQPLPTAPPAPKVMAPPTPEQLVSLIEGIDGVVVKTICAARNKNIPPEEFMRLAKIPKEDRAQLVELAPFAAEYAPAAMEYIKPAAAICFLLVWGISVASRVKHMHIIDEQLEAKKPGRMGPTPVSVLQ